MLIPSGSRPPAISQYSSKSCCETKTFLSERSQYRPWHHLHSVLRSSGTSPNFLITLASLKLPGVAGAAECDSTNVTLLAGQRLSAHLSGHRIEAFGWFGSRHAIVADNDWQAKKYVTPAMVFSPSGTGYRNGGSDEATAHGYTPALWLAY
jgi:hypothetical protein